MKKINVAVGISGGVDSMATALLLLEQGYNVIGYFMDIGAEYGKASKECDLENVARKEAVEAAKILGIELITVDLKDSFKKIVVDYFVNEYIKGSTPNPCIVCNQFLKFGLLFDEAMAKGMDFFATGHYVRIMETANKRWILKKGADHHKDQSYSLYWLTQKQLAHLLFPLGNLEKKSVRKLLSAYNIEFSEKKESQEICFIPDDNHGLFIERSCPEKVKAGKIISEDGEQLGVHSGLPYYTIGQRRGLRLAMGERYYVKEIRSKTNEIIVSDLNGLRTKGLLAKSLNWIAFDDLEDSREVMVKIRYNAQPVKAIVSPTQFERVEVIFSSPAVAVALGQSIVFYDDDILLGGGIIERPIN